MNTIADLEDFKNRKPSCLYQQLKHDLLAAQTIAEPLYRLSYYSHKVSINPMLKSCSRNKLKIHIAG
jgi:hypothetical protein